MRVAILTREYPPEVYGGAGVHVEFLTRELRRTIDVDVHCMGAPRAGATAYAADDPRLAGGNPALRVLSADLMMATGVEGCDVVHSHTWYANLAGHLAKLLQDLPHVLTAHSLEPRRPWKAEQLGGGYRLSRWAERTAYEAADAIIAVSRGMRADILDCYPALDPDVVHVVHNGVDTEMYQPTADADRIEHLGIDLDRPYVAFVGRLTRQKGVTHLLRAALRFDPGAQIVMVAGAADTPEVAAECAAALARLRTAQDAVFWIAALPSRADLVQLLSHAAVFVCPSIYEPLGIVNLEAMACRTAVVASAVGGIPEVVSHGETGLLVPYDDGDTEEFERTLADAVNELLNDAERAAAMGKAGRERVCQHFGWDAVAERTLDVYASVVAAR